MIYLDNAATTRIADEVLAEMLPFLKQEYGNPGSNYELGRNARKAIEKAREQVAAFINARPDQIIFTSGGSEANNMVFHSMMPCYINSGATKWNIIAGGNEHDSVLNSLMSIKSGFDIRLVPVLKTGRVNAESILPMIDDNTLLVSVMHTNNETGAINPIEEIGELCDERLVYFHTDCVQAAGCSHLDVQKFNCDYLSLSSHKIHGPKGVGALFVKDLNGMLPLIYGGHEQEFGLRGGTQNVPGIVGFGAACEYMMARIDLEQRNNRLLKQVFFHELEYQLIGSGITAHVNGGEQILSNESKTANILIGGVDAETLLMLLDSANVYASAGSACRSNEQEPSRTLLSMGIDPEDARCSIRISVSSDLSEANVRTAAKIVADKAKLIRSMANG